MRYSLHGRSSLITYCHHVHQCDIEGGAASGALPHAVLGRGPISSTSDPPAAISLWANHGLFQGLPLNCADWMYLLTAETFLAVMVNTLPPASVIRLSSKRGLPIS